MHASTNPELGSIVATTLVVRIQSYNSQHKERLNSAETYSTVQYLAITNIKYRFSHVAFHPFLSHQYSIKTDDALLLPTRAVEPHVPKTSSLLPDYPSLIPCTHQGWARSVCHEAQLLMTMTNLHQSSSVQQSSTFIRYRCIRTWHSRSAWFSLLIPVLTNTSPLISTSSEKRCNNIAEPTTLNLFARRVAVWQIEKVPALISASATWKYSSCTHGSMTIVHHKM